MNLYSIQQNYYLKPGRENASNTQLRSPIFPSHINGYNFYLNL